jgi:hypothetical protein
VDVRSRETQQPESSVDKQVLPAIVLDQSVPVVTTVVLEDEPGCGIVKVRPPDEAILAVIEIRLDLWPRQATLE